MTDSALGMGIVFMASRQFKQTDDWNFDDVSREADQELKQKGLRRSLLTIGIENVRAARGVTVALVHREGVSTCQNITPL
ncbi:MAG: hypothetical protein Q9216_001059 [Gyalolechia sp. 2 TL-2023]